MGDALMALFDRPVTALTSGNSIRARLLEGLLHDALIPSAEGAMEAGR